MANIKGILIGAGVLLLGGGIWYISHRDRRDARRSDNATADPSDPATKFAKEWYSALNVDRNTFGNGYTAGWYFRSPDQADINRIYNIALKTYNYAKVQKVFSSLTANTLTLPVAIDQAVGKVSDAVKNANNYIGMKKVVTAAATTMYHCNKEGTLAKVASNLVKASIAKGESVGAFINEKKLTVNGKQQQYYIALRSMENGNPAYFAVLKSACKLM